MVFLVFLVSKYREGAEFRFGDAG